MDKYGIAHVTPHHDEMASHHHKDLYHWEIISGKDLTFYIIHQNHHSTQKKDLKPLVRKKGLLKKKNL